MQPPCACVSARRPLATSLAAVACAALILAPAAAPAVDAGQRAPSFTAPSVAGDASISLDAFRGRVVFVDFWASWCAPCAQAIPALEALREEFPADAFQIVGVNLDREPGQARRFLAKHPVGYPSASDPHGRIPESFGLETMPTSYLIDREGVVRYVHRGFRKGDIATLRRHIAELVGAAE